MGHLGLGMQALGSTPFGVGEAEQAADQEGGIFRDTLTGATLSGRALDRRTKRYTFDANGRIVGMTTGQQKVLLAVTTDEGSSAVKDLGNRLRTIKVIGVNFTKQLNDIYALALARLVSRKEIALLSVEPQRVGTTGAFVLVRFRDLTTNTEQTLEVR